LGAGGSAAADERADDAGAAADVDGADDAGAAADVDGADDAPGTDLGGAGAADVGGSSGALQALVEITKPRIGIEPSIELRIETLRSGRHALAARVRKPLAVIATPEPHEALDELVRKTLHQP